MNLKQRHISEQTQLPVLTLLSETVSNRQILFAAICDRHGHELILTQSVGRVSLEQSPEQRLGLCTEELRHSQTCPAGRDRKHPAFIISPEIKSFFFLE